MEVTKDITTMFEIADTCEKHGTRKYSFGSGVVKICKECAIEQEQESSEAEQNRIEQSEKYRTERENTERIKAVVNEIGEVFYGFDLNKYIYPPRIGEVIKRLIMCQPKTDKVKAFFTGAPGTGKTLTASLITREYGITGATVKFISMQQFSEIFFSPGFDKKTELIHQCKTAQVFVLDDIEHCRFNESLAHTLKDIIDYRDTHKHKSVMIITSNQPKNIKNVPVMNERRLGEFVMLVFGSIPYPYGEVILTEPAKRILAKIKELGQYTMRQAMIELNINSPQQHFAQLLTAREIIVSGTGTTPEGKYYKIYGVKK